MGNFFQSYLTHRTFSRFALVLALVFSQSACSYWAPFVVINRTHDAISIRYEVKSPRQNQFAPKIMRLPELEEGSSEWQTFPVERARIDNENGIVDIVLMPNEVLLIESTDAVLVAEKPSEWLNTKSINIQLPNGSIDLQGNQVFEAFEPIDNGRFTFGPRVTRYELTIYAK